MGLFLLEEKGDEKQRNDWGRTRAKSTSERVKRRALWMMGRANNVYNTGVQKRVSDLSSMRSFMDSL